jgi:hypothetical protein
VTADEVSSVSTAKDTLSPARKVDFDAVTLKRTGSTEIVWLPEIRVFGKTPPDVPSHHQA